MNKKIIGIFVCMLLIGTTLPVLGNIKEDTSKHLLINNNDIDGIINDFMNAYNIPGLSAGIVKSDEIVWKNAYGYANLEENIKVENSTIFIIASVSKTITCTAIMQLYEQDYFELNDPINDYLPFQVNHPVFDTDITFQMLLTHTSSLRDNWDFMPLYEGDSPLSLGYYLEEYFTPGGEFYSSDDNFYNDLEPGTSLNYCNNAIALVGYLVEVISGIPFDEYCEINIFNSLDMDETAWFLKDLNIDNIAVPYDYNEDWELEPLKHVGESRYPAGQLRTSSPQLCNFMISMLNDGTFESNSILNEDTIDLIFTPQFSEMPMMWTDDFIGIIWFGEDTWEFYWHHTGGLPGCSTEIRIYPHDEIGIVVLTNGPIRNPMDQVIDKLYIYGKEITNSPPSNPTCVYDKTNDEVILMSVDPDNDQIRYGISWDNNQNVDNWTDYFNSSLEVRINCDSHKGTIGVIAEDKYGGESVWVSVTAKNKSFNDFYHLIFRLIQRFPIFEKILNQIII